MKIALLGGFLLGIGYLLAGFVGNNFLLKLIGIGIIGGLPRTKHQIDLQHDQDAA